MYTCGHGKPIDEFCDRCTEMGENVLELRKAIISLKQENEKLKVRIKNLNDIITLKNRTINRLQHDNWEDVTYDRDR